MRLLIVLCLTALASVSISPSQAESVVILTGGTSGVYYPLGLALQKLFERELPDVKTSVLSTQATVENLNLLQNGKGQLALAQGDILTEARKGSAEAGFPSSRAKIRLIGAAYPNFIHIIARQDAKIHSAQDLRGKRVSVGASRSGNELNARVLLGAAGLSYADLAHVEYLEYGQSVDLMAARGLDAAIISAGLGVAAVKRAVSQMPITFVPVTSDLVDNTHGAFFFAKIPEHTYDSQDAEVSAAALNNFFATSVDVSDDLVYRMTKAIFTNLSELRAAHSAAKLISIETALTTQPIDLHSGAARYFRQTGALH